MGILGAWAAWWLTGRLVLRVLCGQVPALGVGPSYWCDLPGEEFESR